MKKVRVVVEIARTVIIETNTGIVDVETIVMTEDMSESRREIGHENAAQSLLKHRKRS